MSESPSTKTCWKVAVIGFDHMHAGDQIAEIAENRATVLAGVWDTEPERMNKVCDDLEVSDDIRFTDIGQLIERTEPQLAVICSATSEHRRHVEYFAARGIHVLLEKPFASNLEDAHAMANVATAHSIQLGINWPLAWYPVHRTAHRLIHEETIGTVTEVHYYDGNRGPLFHTHGKRETDAAFIESAKASTWWYSAEHGGGSLRDYLGYGTTLATWFRQGELPLNVTARVHNAPGDEVDEQSVVIASYEYGLSTFQTRWGTFTDPWTQQPNPRCGFVIVGTAGTIASFDYAAAVEIQTREHPEGRLVPVDAPPREDTSGIASMVHALETDSRLRGPISWETSLAGQRIVEAAHESAIRGTTVNLGEIQ